MRRQYGGRKSRGTCPERFEKSAGGLIRHIMQVGSAPLFVHPAMVCQYQRQIPSYILTSGNGCAQQQWLALQPADLNTRRDLQTEEFPRRQLQKLAVLQIGLVRSQASASSQTQLPGVLVS